MIFAGLGKALDAFEAYRPTSWSRSVASPRGRRLHSKEIRKAFDLLSFLGRAALVAGIAANAAAGGIRLDPTVRSKDPIFTLNGAGAAASQVLALRGSNSGQYEVLSLSSGTRSVQALQFVIPSDAFRVLEPQAHSVRLLPSLSSDQRERAIALSEPLQALGISPLVALAGNSGELIIEAGRAERTLTIIQTAERCVALFRESEDEVSMHIEELPLTPAPERLATVGNHYLATEWSERT